jgi:riboflavin kinase
MAVVFSFFGFDFFFSHNLTQLQEVHVVNDFEKDFYDKTLKAIALEYIRPELNFSSLGSLLSV